MSPSGLGRRPTWIAAHTQPGEEHLVARVHLRLTAKLPGLRTIVVPAEGSRCAGLRRALREEHGLAVDMWAGAGGSCECVG